PAGECKPLWKQGPAYQGGDQVQHNGRIYRAMWHTSREPGDPAYTDTTNQGWGFEWADKGACTK
ncbi:carbohydrate-binding protein, partial [Glaciimonas immobilis]